MLQFISTFKEVIPNELRASIQSIYNYATNVCSYMHVSFMYTGIEDEISASLVNFQSDTNLSQLSVSKMCTL